MGDAILSFLEAIIGGLPPGGPKPGPRMALANRIANYSAVAAVAAVGVWIAYEALH